MLLYRLQRVKQWHCEILKHDRIVAYCYRTTDRKWIIYTGTRKKKPLPLGEYDYPEDALEAYISYVSLIHAKTKGYK